MLSRCPPSWVNLGDYGCFHFADYVEPMTWMEGFEFCMNITSGANLAVIPNARTQAFVEILADEHYDQSWLIGGIGQEGQWFWLNGEQMFYNHWDFGEPSNSNNGENCLELLKRNRRWNDIDCTASYGENYRRPICQLFL